MKFQEFKIENLNDFTVNLDKLLTDNLLNIDNLIQKETNDYNKIIKPLQELDNNLHIFFTPLSHLNSVKNSKNIQKIYQNSISLLSKYSSKISQNKELFRKLTRIENINNFEEQEVLHKKIQDFILSGANLSEKLQKELEDISLELSQLANNFSQNILDDTNKYKLILEDKKDINGIPETDLKLSEIEIDGKTCYKWTLHAPSYLAYMTYGQNRKYREELYKAFSSKAPNNKEIINKILKLREREANILGFDNFTDLSLETKDAKSAKDVIDFLEKLKNKFYEQAKIEIKEVKDLAKKLDGISNLQSFDTAYYSEKLKNIKFNFNENDTKPYFEKNRTLDGMINLVSKIFNISFKEISIETWDKKVKTYDIYENKKLMGRIYFDLEARDNKLGGAWMNNWETHFIDSKNIEHLSSVFVVCNFSPSTKNQKSTLRHYDVVTLFHEMGHAIHHLFSKCREFDVSGVNGIAWDVVEFPSQFLENFAYEKSILKDFAFHYETGEIISNDLLDKIKKSKDFQIALGTLRQVEFSLFDIRLHLKLYQKDEIQTLLDEIRRETSLLEVPKYNKFQNGFSHIFAGGYAAGYFSYKWAEVLSLDAFKKCFKNDKIDLEKLSGYKKYILEKGSSRNMRELFKAWLI